MKQQALNNEIQGFSTAFPVKFNDFQV